MLMGLASVEMCEAEILSILNPNSFIFISTWSHELPKLMSYRHLRTLSQGTELINAFDHIDLQGKFSLIRHQIENLRVIKYECWKDNLIPLISLFKNSP